MKKISITHVFCLAVVVSALLWALFFFINPEGIQRNIFNKPLDTLFSDFNCVRTNSVEGYFGTSQESKDLCYPAFGPTMALLFPFTQSGAAAFTIVGTVLWVLSLAAMFPIRKFPIALIIGCAFSQIFIHAFQWGNQIIYAAAGVTLFFAWHDSKSVWKRRIAALALATGSVLKITPAIFSVVYFTKWRNSADEVERKAVFADFVLFVASSIILFFVPFSWYGGVGGFLKWMSNAAENANHYVACGAWGTVPIGRTIRILLKFPGMISESGTALKYPGIGIERVVSMVIGMSCFARAMHLSCKTNLNSQIVMLLAGALLLIPGNMHVYTGLYLMPVIVMQLKCGLTCFEALCWFLFLSPLQIPVGSGCINHPVANLAFLALLFRNFIGLRGSLRE